MKSTKEFVCKYYHDGAWWGLNIHAYDMEDAKARVAKLGNLQLNGELIMSIPCIPGAGLFVKATCWVRNSLWGKAPLFIALLLPSCVVAPYVKESPDGSLTASMGGVFAARRKNVVAEITTRQGHVIKYMTEEESGEDVPNNFIAAWLTRGLAKIQGHTTDLKTTTDGSVALGAQQTEVAKETIKAGAAATAGEQANQALLINKAP